MSKMASPSDAEDAHRPRPLCIWDLAWIGFALLFMAAFWYLRSRNHPFWGDELNAYVLMQQKSFWAMMHNWRLSLDSGSLFYASVGYWWVRIFSPPEMALRAFSAAGMAASFVILWITARRFFSVTIVGACLPLAFFLNEYVRWQFYNGRMYGGFMAATALVIYAMVRAAPDRPLTNRVLLLTFFAHLFLMSSHVLGLMYSGVFVGGLVAQDLWARAFRPRLYLSAIASWLVLVITYANIRNTAALSQFGYFTQTPHFIDLVKGAAVYSRAMLLVLALLLVTAFLAPRITHSKRPAEPVLAALRPIHFVLLSCAAIVLLAFAVSRLKTSIFYNRYLLPVSLGDALLMCELLFWTVRSVPKSAALRYAGVSAAILIFLAVYVRGFPRGFLLPQADLTGALLGHAAPGLPLVITDPGVFSDMDHYQGSRRTIVTPLDWSVSLGPDSDYSTASGTLQLERWKSGGIFPGHILSSAEILQDFPAFVLLSTPEHETWFERYVKNNKRFEVSQGEIFRDQQFWTVRRRTTAPQ